MIRWGAAGTRRGRGENAAVDLGQGLGTLVADLVPVKPDLFQRLVGLEGLRWLKGLGCKSYWPNARNNDFKYRSCWISAMAFDIAVAIKIDDACSVQARVLTRPTYHSPAFAA